VVWLDGLDIPLIRTLGVGFAENYPKAEQALVRPEGDSLARYGANMLPVRHTAGRYTSPIFNYPYERTCEALYRLERSGECDAWDGIKLRYVNPVTGGHAMSTMATFMQLLPQGFAGKTWRSTDATVFCVVEGCGSVHIGPQIFHFGPRDIFVAPSWQPVRFSAPTEDVVLFSYSDRPVQEALGLLREQRID